MKLAEAIAIVTGFVIAIILGIIWGHHDRLARAMAADPEQRKLLEPAA
jgi:hypothetical protein